MTVDPHTIGFVIHTLGELLVAFTVLRVHGQVVHDRKVDKRVLNQMKLEQWLGMTGLLFIIAGFIIEITS